MADQPTIDPAEFQAALGEYFKSQFGAVNAAEAAALNNQAANQEKIGSAVDQTLAAALMGSGRGGGAGGAVQFPPEVFDLAVALTKQPALQGPIFAFYAQLQQEIDKAVQIQLKKFSALAGGSDGQGSESSPDAT